VGKRETASDIGKNKFRCLELTAIISPATGEKKEGKKRGAKKGEVHLESSQKKKKNEEEKGRGKKCQKAKLS